MTKRPRRSPEQWLALIEQQQACGLSIADFYKWKQRWLEQNHVTDSHQADAFIDLTKLDHPPTGAWNIVLRLGNGMELQLSNG